MRVSPFLRLRRSFVGARRLSEPLLFRRRVENTARSLQHDRPRRGRAPVTRNRGAAEIARRFAALRNGARHAPQRRADLRDYGAWRKGMIDSRRELSSAHERVRTRERRKSSTCKVSSTMSNGVKMHWHFRRVDERRAHPSAECSPIVCGQRVHVRIWSIICLPGQRAREPVTAYSNLYDKRIRSTQSVSNRTSNSSFATRLAQQFGGMTPEAFALERRMGT